MPITEARLARLREFGLSEYAGRAYLALLDLGAAEARHISGLSKVPTSKIYHVLEQLHDRGLVEVLPEFPKRYAPIPFEDFLDRRRREHEETARAIERDRQALLAEFAISGDTRLPDRGGFQVVRGRNNVNGRLLDVAAAAQTDLLLLATPGLAARGAALAPALAAASARGVRIRVVLPPSTPMAAAAAWAPTAEWAVGRAGSTAALAVADQRSAVLAAFVPDDESATRGKDVAALTDHQALAGLLRGLAEREWERAAHDPTVLLVRGLREAALLVQNGRVRALSPSAEEILGHPEAEVAGREVAHLIPGGVPEETEAGPLDARVRRRDGTETPVALSVSPLAGKLAVVIFRQLRREVPVESPRVAQTL